MATDLLDCIGHYRPTHSLVSPMTQSIPGSDCASMTTTFRVIEIYNNSSGAASSCTLQLSFNQTIKAESCSE